MILKSGSQIVHSILKPDLSLPKYILSEEEKKDLDYEKEIQKRRKEELETRKQPWIYQIFKVICMIPLC